MGERGLLTPWLRCGTCGGKVRVWQGGRKGKRTYLYYCATRVDNPAACEGISIRCEKLDRLVLDVIKERVLSPKNVQALIDDSLERLAATPLDEAASERERLSALVADLDRRIRMTAAQVVNGLIEQDDAKALNAPLLAQRETTRLQLAGLPSPQPLPDTVDPDAFRAAVLEAWANRPLEDRREALDRLLDRVTLSPGGVRITYGYCHHEPPGPPEYLMFPDPYPDRPFTVAVIVAPADGVADRLVLRRDPRV